MAGRRITPNSQEQHRPEILRRLLAGDGLSEICRTEGLPGRETVRQWCLNDPAFADQVREAREEGFQDRAERAVADAKSAKDGVLGRLAFDAERWYLGKLSNAFAERPPREGNQTNIQVNVDAGSGFGRLAGVLDRAATAIAGSANGTHRLAGDGTAGTGDTGGGLVDMADPGGSGLGEDTNGG